MASPYHLAIPGAFVVVGKQPDGDSVRFVADDPDQLRNLRNGHRVRVSGDKSVQLRFEAIDAPEVHYGSAAQPLGPEARAAALEWLGFRNVKFAPDGMTVTGARPTSVRGLIMSKAVEVNGRPIAYVLREESPVRGRGWKVVDRKVLAATLNHHMVRTGAAYPTFYTSTPRPHRQILHTLAAQARLDGLGVWELDSTFQFVLEDQRSIGPDGGALILPKLFRRATDYLKDRADGFAGTFPEWILDVSLTPFRDENDRLVIDDRIEVRLADVVQQRNRRIHFQADPLDIVFVEK